MSKGMTWTNLESIRMWGAPTVIDGVPLTLLQGRALMSTVEKLMDDAEYPKEEAVERAVVWFRRMFEVSGEEWVAVPEVKVHGGATVKNKYHAADSKARMVEKLKRKMREEADRRRRALEAVRGLAEAGKRNSTADKGKIATALAGLFDVLNRTDQEDVVKALGKRLGRSIRFKKQEAK